MDKQEFEQRRSSIRAGDLVLVVTDGYLSSDKTFTYALVGVYEPIDGKDHWYIAGKQDQDAWIGTGFTLGNTTAIDRRSVPDGVFQTRSGAQHIHVQYSHCRAVVQLMDASDLEGILVTAAIKRPENIYGL
ncbi:MAG: hypothetical protein HY544_00785 [Candidatus Diapherotrites archaeon]|uniref:Uncharacterized protein n=1 Tax=Candidatus Iainarchaeum sp. TaxID=3101447 RepID=A0A8T3YLT3_9ARCH|nr:hypothetical protein [Candidatus Diapherotrites archaeon]